MRISSVTLNAVVILAKLNIALGQYTYDHSPGFCDDLCGNVNLETMHMNIDQLSTVNSYADYAAWCSARNDCLGFGKHFLYDRVYLRDKMIQKPEVAACEHGVGLSGGNNHAEHECYVKVAVATPSPTVTPTAGPSVSIAQVWGIQFKQLSADLSAGSTGQMKTTYTIGNGGTPRAQLYGNCTSLDDASTIAGGIIAENLANITWINGTHRSVDFVYAINMSALGSTPYWKAEEDLLSVCEQVKLSVDHNDETYEVSTLLNELIIKADTTVGFSVTTNLAAASIDQSNSTTTLSDSLDPFRCKGKVGGGYAVDDAPLSPNDPLFVCLFPKADAVGVEVKEVESMVLEQSGAARFNVIAGGAINANTISSTFYLGEERGILVRTMVPQNLIDFSATGTMTVRGAVAMAFVGSDGTRRLRAANALAAAGAAGNEAVFDIEISLVGEVGAADNFGVLSPAASFKVKTAFIVLGMVSSLALSIW